MPRVLTYDEMCNLCADQWIWVEIDNLNGYPILNCDGLYHLQLVSDVDICLGDIIIEAILPQSYFTFNAEDMGWRIWSDKPTEEEMRSTEWDYSSWPNINKCIECKYCVPEKCICIHYGINCPICLNIYSMNLYEYCRLFKPLNEITETKEH